MIIKFKKFENEVAEVNQVDSKAMVAEQLAKATVSIEDGQAIKDGQSIDQSTATNQIESETLLASPESYARGINAEQVENVDDEVDQVAEVATTEVADTLDESIASQAKSIRNYLISSYDYDLTRLRCQRSGRLTKVISDKELVDQFQLCDYDLTKLAEELERFALHNSPICLNWLNTSTDRLLWLRDNDEISFLRFAILSLVEDNGYYRSFYQTSVNRLSTEGRFQLVIDFWRFCETIDEYVNTLDHEELRSLNEKLLLLLCIGSTSKIESITNKELSFEKLASITVAGKLLTFIDKIINVLLNDYRIKNGLSFDEKLSIADIERIASNKVARQNENRQAENLKAKLFRDLKRSRDNDGYLDNLIGEAMLANRDKSQFIQMLELRKAVAQLSRRNLDKITLNLNLAKGTQQVADLNKEFKPIKFKAI